MRFLLLAACALALAGCDTTDSASSPNASIANPQSSPGPRMTHRTYNEGDPSSVPAYQQNGTQ